MATLANQTISLFDYSLNKGPLDQINFDSKCLINTINQYSYVMAEKDAEFKSALMESDVLLPDGMAIVAAAKLINNESITKIAGADIHKFMLEKLNKKGGSCFYLGSSEKTLKLIRERIAVEYPNVRVGSFSPAYKPEFNDAENAEMIAAVNEFQPDALFVGMTAPKQEKWATKHKQQLNVKTICSIGAVFDFYAGTVERPAQVWIDLNLEWFVRLVKEPKRMWKRYMYYGPVFVYQMIGLKIQAMMHKPEAKTIQMPIIPLNVSNISAYSKAV
jgi:N-acetylglucosaminyldiphosphoundecaprenol N-acetyl-beta-D-mannosaminyltransferase